MANVAWLRCAIVSAVVALIAPPFVAITMVPSEGENVVDLRAVSAEDLAKLHSGHEFAEYVKRVPMRKLHGLERFTYYFEHPQYAHFYFRSVLTFFVPLFGSTLLVSYLQGRSRGRV